MAMQIAGNRIERGDSKPDSRAREGLGLHSTRLSWTSAHRASYLVGAQAPDGRRPDRATRPRAVPRLSRVEHPQLGTLAPDTDAVARGAERGATRSASSRQATMRPIGSGFRIRFLPAWCSSPTVPPEGFGSASARSSFSTPRPATWPPPDARAAPFIQALRHLGKEQVNDQVLAILRRHVEDKDRPTLRKDLIHAPAWIAEILAPLTGTGARSMNTFLLLPAERRRLAFQQVDADMGLQAFSVEKDFWVCWTLRALFELPGLGEHLTFKGGTSLSKAWKLIHRFSEDIDLIIDKEPLGFGGEASPDKAPSKKKRKERLDALKVAARAWVQGQLQPALAARIAETIGSQGWRLEVDPDGGWPVPAFSLSIRLSAGCRRLCSAASEDRVGCRLR